MTKIRTRFAPSPTGFLHVGSLRTALYCYLFAKKYDGKFILRIEDTDQKRFVEGAIDVIINGLKWAGIAPDEDPILGGEYGPYIQSQRLPLYKKYVQELLAKNKAYYCFCSEERINNLREKQVAEKKPPGYDRHCRDLSSEEVEQKLQNGEQAVIRFKAPLEGTTLCSDLIRGDIEFQNNLLEDYVLLKTDGYPTYHLALIVDDHLMEISHVFRSEEWLSSLHLHVLLYKAFGWEQPEFAHLPMVLNTDKTKMSKRKGDVFLHSYIEKGYLKEALVNFLALLGWNPGDDREIFSLEELAKEFSIEKVHKAGAVFDNIKLDWMNGHYLRLLSIEDFTKKCLPYLVKENFVKADNNVFVAKDGEVVDIKYIQKAVKTEQERIKSLREITEKAFIYFDWQCSYYKELLVFKKQTEEEVIKSLEFSLNLLQTLDENSFDDTQELFNIIATKIKEAGKKNGEILWPLRVSLSGLKQSPSPFEIANVIGRERTLKRIKQALDKF